jgi:small conductance mechanosensitive channel
MNLMTRIRSIASLAIAALLLLAGADVRAQEVDTTAAAAAATAVAPEPDTIPGLYDHARALFDSLRWSSDSLRTVAEKLLNDPDADVSFGRVQALKYARQQHRILIDLAELLREAPGDSLPADSLTGELRGYLVDHISVLDQAYARQVSGFDELRHQRASASVEEIGPLEAEIADVWAWTDTIVVYQMSAITAAEQISVDVAREWEQLDELLEHRAEQQVGRLQIAVADRDRLEARVKTLRRTGAPESEITDLQRNLSAVQSRIDAIATSLGVTNELLRGRGFDTVAYREILIRTTGEVTGDVLDPQVLLRLVGDLATDAWDWIRDNTATILARILIVVGFVILFRFLFRLGWWLARTLRLVRGSRLISDTLGRSLRPVATLLGFMVGLSVIGVQTTTLLAGLGVAGVVVGFALQDSLSNLFAGISILAMRPYDVDDVVEAGGVLGRVREMGLWNTTIVTFDARRLLVPNKSIWTQIIENRSAEPMRRVEAIARIGYDDDLQKVVGVFYDMLKSDERVLDEPAPQVFASSLAESWIEVKLWPWVKNSDWWSLTADLPRLIRLRLDEEGIAIPYPRREIVQSETVRGEGPKSDAE